MLKQVVDMLTIAVKRGLKEETMTCSVAFYFQGLSAPWWHVRALRCSLRTTDERAQQNTTTKRGRAI